MIGAMTGRTVAVDPALVARQQPVERGHEIDVGAGSELHDHHPRGGVRDEDGQEAVAFSGDETLAGVGQIEDAAPIAGLDGELGRLHARKTTGWPRYGKKLRMASRSRDGSPFTGADS